MIYIAVKGQLTLTQGGLIEKSTSLTNVAGAANRVTLDAKLSLYSSAASDPELGRPHC